jgi:Uma2 family endonuclease
MTQARSRFSSFEEYLSYSDGLEGRYLLIDGELVELPPESEPNDFIANYLMVRLASCGIAPLRLIRPGKCEIQVPVLEPKDPANRFPDLVILREEHIPLTERRLTITVDMPPPQLVAEVISPGKTNWERDTVRKRAQYANRCIPEYWLIAPKAKTVTVLVLQGDRYQVSGVFQGDEAIVSPTFGTLAIGASQIFSADV